MEDVGMDNLEQNPQPEYFLESAKELARLRSIAAAHISHGALNEETLNKYTMTSQIFLDQLDDLIRASSEDNLSIFQKAKIYLPDKINQLYEQVPLTLVHHDYHAKNLVANGARIMPIDWSNAYLSPHLGDLYGLMQEANSYSGVSDIAMQESYLSELGNDSLSLDQLAWQVNIGGICWLIRTLRWLIYDGTKLIPGSAAWIPDLCGDLNQLLSES